MNKTKKYVPRYLFKEIASNTDVSYDVIIDTREHSKYESKFVNRLTEILDSLNYTWIKTKLPCGDYLINRGRGLLIERKTVSDLINTAFGERNDGIALDSELKKMVELTTFNEKKIPICLCCENGRTIQIIQRYIEEKDDNITMMEKKKKKKKFYEERSFSYIDEMGKERISNIYPNGWISITQKIQSYMPYYEFEGTDHLISWIITKLRAEIEYEKKEIKNETDIHSLRMINKSNILSLDDQLQMILESIQGIGAISAIKILKKYRTLKTLITSIHSPSDLIALGIHKNDAEYFYNIIQYQYSK